MDQRDRAERALARAFGLRARGRGRPRHRCAAGSLDKLWRELDRFAGLRARDIRHAAAEATVAHEFGDVHPTTIRRHIARHSHDTERVRRQFTGRGSKMCEAARAGLDALELPDPKQGQISCEGADYEDELARAQARALDDLLGC